MEELNDILRRPPLLIIDGFAPIPWLPKKPIGDLYANLGHDPRFMPFSIRNMRDVETYARAIGAKARQIVKGSGFSCLNVIAFSMGGVAIYYGLKRLGLAPFVSTLICYAAPFGGADLSYLALPTGLWTRIGRQLHPGSRFLTNLTAGNLPAETRLICVGGRHDGICPAERARLPGAKFLTLPYSHLDFLIRLDLHRELEHLLD